jgi:hypothetical protein
LALALQSLAAVSKPILSAAALAVLLSFAGACAQFDGDDLDESTEIEFPAHAEQIWVEGSAVAVANDGTEGIASGACDCTTPECFESYVDESFGCDVCVSFFCDGVTVAHACAACDKNALHQGQTWNGDGRLSK